MTVIPDRMQRSIRMAYVVLAALLGFLGTMTVSSFHVGRRSAKVERQLEEKLDASRFTRDSTRRDADRLSDRELLLRIDRRVSSMYCDGKPAGCQ